MPTRVPQPALRPFVTLLWASEALGRASRLTDGAPAVREHVLPTGHMHLVFRLTGSPLRVFRDANDQRGSLTGHALVGGARAGYYVRDISRPAGSVGAMLRPGAAELLFGATAAELAHRHTPLDDIWGRSADLARERLFEAGDSARRLDVLEALLAERLPTVRGMHPAVAEALQRFGTLERVDAVVKLSGYSHRHFVTMFRRAVGLSPKRYCRVRRFQAALQMLHLNDRAPLAATALAAGYSDQAHFSREFVAFAGVAPAAYRRLAPEHPGHLPVIGEARSDSYKTGADSRSRMASTDD